MDENGTIHERITQLVETYGQGKNTVFASIIGSNEANVRGYRASVMPKFDFLEKIARNIDINLKWLLTGEGSMLRADEPPTNSVTPSTDAPAASAKPDESILYNMYKDLQAEKREKEAKIEELNAKMLAMSEEIGRLKAKLGEEEPEVETHPKGLGQKTAEDVSIKKRSSQSYPDAPSVGVPSGGR